jgi:hypothetical protein
VSTQHEEFPELTQQTQAAYRAGCRAAGPVSPTPLTKTDRRYLAAFLLEALGQAGVYSAITWSDESIIGKLSAIANNLHSPPPPPPTLAQAREADMDTPAGRDVVRTFLASLGEREEP